MPADDGADVPAPQLLLGKGLYVHDLRHVLRFGQPDPAAPQEVPHREGAGLVGAHVRELVELRDQLRVHPTGEVSELVPADLVEPAPIDDPVAWYGCPAAAPGEREQLAERSVREHAVVVVGFPHHAVPEAVRSTGELQRHERLAFEGLPVEPEEFSAARPHVVQDVRVDDSGQEVIEDEPLVVPPHRPARVMEGGPLAGLLRLGEGGRAVVVLAPRQHVHHPIVELEEGDVGLGNDEVLVVAVVANHGPAVAPSGQVVGKRLVRVGGPDGRAEPEAGLARRQAGVVEVGLPPRPLAVEAVEVQGGRPRLLYELRVVLHGEVPRLVAREVVVDELPEVCEARGDLGVLEGRVFRQGLPHRAAQIDEGPVGGPERIQPREHLPEPLGAQEVVHHHHAGGVLALPAALHHAVDEFRVQTFDPVEAPDEEPLGLSVTPLHPTHLLRTPTDAPAFSAQL